MHFFIDSVLLIWCYVFSVKAGTNRTTCWPTCCPTNHTNMLVRFASTIFLSDQHVYMSIHLRDVFIKKRSKFYDFDIRIVVKKIFKFKFHVGQHVGLHRKLHQHVILARFYKFVGQHLLFFFKFFNKCWPAFFLHFFLRQHVRAQSKPDQHVG